MSKYVVVYDTETTGLSAKEDRILQLAAIKVNKETGKTVGEWAEYILPEGDWLINPDAEVVHGLTKEFIIENGKSLRVVGPEFLKFIEGCDLCGFNSNSFDIRFLYNEFTRIGLEIDMDRRFYDVRLMELQLNPTNLRALFEKYTGSTMDDAGLPPHDAKSDVRATAAVLRTQMEDYDLTWADIDEWDCNNLISPEGSVRTAGEDLYVFAFGKYINKDIYEVLQTDPDYLSWWVGNVASKYTANMVREYLIRKRDNK